MLLDTSFCQNSGFLQAIYIIKCVINIICTAGPVIVVITSMISLFKCVTSDKDVKEATRIFITKFIICALIFFIPTLVTAFMTVIDNGNVSENFLSCYNNATQDKIEYYKSKEKSESEAKIAERKAQEEQNAKNNAEQNEERKARAKKNIDEMEASKEEDTNSSSTESSGNVGSIQNTNTKGTLFVGDSRTVGMYFALYGGSYSSSINSTQGSQKWLAKVGTGYSWFTSTAISYIKSYVSSGNYTVTIQMGANDLYNSSLATSYVNQISSLASSYPNSNFVIISVNPINDSTAKSNNYTVTNSQAIAFNNKYRSAISSSGKSNISYCDTYSKIINNYSSPDGLHYNNTTYKNIYNGINSCI